MFLDNSNPTKTARNTKNACSKGIMKKIHSQLSFSTLGRRHEYVFHIGLCIKRILIKFPFFWCFGSNYFFFTKMEFIEFVLAHKSSLKCHFMSGAVTDFLL